MDARSPVPNYHSSSPTFIVQHEEKPISLSLYIIIQPLLAQLEKQGEKNLSAVQTLKTAFAKSEKDLPGVTQSFIESVLDAESLNINLPESLLRLAYTSSQEFTLTRSEQEFRYLNQRADSLRATLSRIPEQIHDRARFLQTVKDIAAAIKEVLDAVNDVLKKYPTLANMREYKRYIDLNKKVFIKHSKSFSDTLKGYFKDGRSDRVFDSANRLINQTNELLRIFKLAGEE